MARSAEQIESDLSNSIEAQDNSYDVSQGPIKDLFTIPLSGIIAEVEQQAEDLRKLFSLQFSEVATEDEIRKALNNFGSYPNEGSKSTHNQHFLRFTRPKEDIVIPIGTLVSNNTGNLVYRTIETVTMLADQADTYYNPTRKAYEIVAKVESDGVGGEYALSARRIQTIMSSLNGIDATENRTKSSQGLPTETLDNQYSRLQTRLTGLNLNTFAGIPEKIKESMSNNVSLVQVITPSQPEFKRIQYKPSIDVYVHGDSSQINTESFNAISGQTEIYLTKQPVLSVESVIINNSASVSFKLIKDSTNESSNSLSSKDYILLDLPLSSGDSIEVNYTYNKLLEDVSNIVLDGNSQSLFMTDTLIRGFIEVSPIISFELKVISSYSFDDVASNIRQYIIDDLSNAISGRKMSPNEYRDVIIDNISGIQSLRVLKFRRDTGSLSNIETVILYKNEITKYVEENIDIRAVR